MVVYIACDEPPAICNANLEAVTLVAEDVPLLPASTGNPRLSRLKPTQYVGRWRTRPQSCSSWLCERPAKRQARRLDAEKVAALKPGV